MTFLNKIKYMPLSDYRISDDTEDVICAVNVDSFFGNRLFPDWSKKIDLTSGTTYTIGSGALANYKAGYIWHSQNWIGDNNFRCTINGITFLGGWAYQDGHDAKLIVFPVSTGDTIICFNGSNRYFLPIKESF